MDERFFDQKSLAEFLGIPPRRLTMMRHRGTGPRFIKIGKGVRYTRQAVEEWLSPEFQSTAEARAASLLNGIGSKR